MRYVRISIIVLLLVLITVFAVQNRKSVEVSFLVWSVKAPQVFIIVGMYVLGMVTGWGLVELLRRAVRK
ncbi:MAG: lipopolysaccharide assembly protein LapA domain-containing protein [Planctomycetota bacterium]